MRKQMRSTFRTPETEDRSIKGNAPRSGGAEHTVGQRNRFLEFSEPILNLNKPAGILTRLNADGSPHISGTSDLTGMQMVDVVGWAPTADGLAFVKNSCSGDISFNNGNYDIIAPTFDTGNANDDALKTLLAQGMLMEFGSMPTKQRTTNALTESIPLLGIVPCGRKASEGLSPTYKLGCTGTPTVAPL
jgi:hypothetical protein